MKKIFILLFLLFPFFITAQQSNDKSLDKKEKKTIEKSIKQQREDKLRYGINTAVLEVLKSLKEEKNSDFNKTLEEILKETKNRNVSENIIDLFILTEYFDADDTVYRFIDEKKYTGKNTFKKAVKYLSLTKKEKYHQDFQDLLKSTNESYRIAAVKALSSSGNKEFTELLIEQYENDDSERVKTEILLNIGELKDNSAVDFLIDIIEDEYIDKTSKQYACNSLGLIGDEKAYPYLMKVYEDPDPYIRSYALNALGKIKKSDNEKLLIQAFRDDSPKIREQAAISAADTKNSSFIPFLKYMAANDPARDVRRESVKSLSKIASADAISFLKEKVTDSKASIELRKLSAVQLINNNFSAGKSAIDKVLKSEWESKAPVLLELICGTLANTESSQMCEYYSRMLDHPSLTVKLSGLKGIRKNKCVSLKNKVKEFTEIKGSSSFKRFAQAVLEDL